MLNPKFKELTDEQLFIWFKQSLSFWRVMKFMVPNSGGKIITINDPMELIDEMKARRKPKKAKKKIKKKKKV